VLRLIIERAVLREADAFNSVFVENGAVSWTDELDLAPDKMHDNLKKAAVYVLR